MAPPKHVHDRGPLSQIRHPGRQPPITTACRTESNGHPLSRPKFDSPPVAGNDELPESLLAFPTTCVPSLAPMPARAENNH